MQALQLDRNQQEDHSETEGHAEVSGHFWGIGVTAGEATHHLILEQLHHTLKILEAQTSLLVILLTWKLNKIHLLKDLQDLHKC